MKSKLPIIHIVLLLLLATATGVLFYITEKNMIEVNALEREVNQQESNIRKLSDLSKGLPQISNEITTYLEALPANETDVAQFADTLESIAKDEGLTVTFHFDDFPKPVDVSGQNITGLGSEMVLEGSFQGLTSFVGRVSALPYFFKIDKMTLVKREQKTGVKAALAGTLMMNVEKKP